MIEKLDLNDSRYRTIMEKVNEMIEELNRLTNHYHEYLGMPEEGNKTSFPGVTDH